MISTLLTHYEHRYSLLKLQSQSSADVKNAQLSFITRLRQCWQLWLPWERRGDSTSSDGIMNSREHLTAALTGFETLWRTEISRKRRHRCEKKSFPSLLDVRSLKHEASPTDNTPSSVFWVIYINATVDLMVMVKMVKWSTLTLHSP